MRRAFDGSVFSRVSVRRTNGGLGGPSARSGVGSGYSGQPSRPGLFRGAVFQHRLVIRSRRQQASRRYPAWRSAARHFSPLYKGQVLVRHGLLHPITNHRVGFDRFRTPSPSSITATNAVSTHYVGRSPHEPFFTPDGKELWVTVRGEDYVAVLDGQSFEENRHQGAAGPRHADLLARRQVRLCLSSFNPENRGHHVPIIRSSAM